MMVMNISSKNQKWVLLQKSSKFLKRSKYRTILWIFVFACIGALLLSISRAANSAVNIEAETGGLGTGAQIITDANASGGQAVKFASAGTGASSNCLPDPSRCGYPDLDTVGVPAGTVLTASGGLTVTQDGAVIDAKSITGTVAIQANNVIIKRSKIIASSGVAAIRVYSGFSNFVLEDSEVEGGTCDVTIGYSNYTIRRSIIHGGVDAIRLGGNTYVYDSYIYDLKRVTGSHNDTFQILGGKNVEVSHNAILAFTGIPGSGLSGGDPMNAILMIGDLSGNIGPLTFDNNLVNGGNYSFNVNWTAVDAGGASLVGPVSITNNRIGRDYRYGPKSNISHGIIWQGNVYDDDGTQIN